MNDIQNSQEFYHSLPRGPLTEHITRVYTILLYTSRGQHFDPNAIAVAIRSLRQIAAYTAEPPEYRIPDRYLQEKRFMDRYGPQESGLDRLREAARRMTANLKQYQASPAVRERTAERLYKSRIEGERAKGLAHVRVEALRVRTELGLPLTDDKTGA